MVRIFLLSWFLGVTTSLMITPEDENNIIIGYDCNPKELKTTVMSLESVDPCHNVSKNSMTKSRRLQLLQLNSDITVDYSQCYVKIHRQVYNCGSGGHIGAVTGGILEYPYELSKDVCSKAVKTGYLCLFCEGEKRLQFLDIKIGKTITKMHTFAGWTDEYGYCGASQFSDIGGDYHNVVVVGFVEVFLNTGVAKIGIEDRIIHFPTGVFASSHLDTLFDAKTGLYVWKPYEPTSCKNEQYDILYEGLGNITSPLNVSTVSLSLVTVMADDISFSLRLDRQLRTCGQRMYTTEHPKLFIIESDDETGFLFKRDKSKKTDFDLFTYVNSKFVYVERNIERNIESMYLELIDNMCMIERQTLNLQLSIAYTNELEYAYLQGGGPGYTASRIGEVMYLSKCTPVMVQFRIDSRCFHELPIYYQNRSLFLSPKNHLITERAREITCNPIYPAMHKVLGRWYQISNGKLLNTVEPGRMKPSTKISWEYESNENLAKTGIYSQEDLDKLSEQIKFGNEREAIQSIIVRGYAGSNVDLQHGSISNLIDEQGIDSMFRKYGSKAWEGIVNFGTFISGLIGVIMIFKLVKWVIDSIINGRALYDLYGFSAAILGGLWDSLTLFLIHRKTNADHFHGKSQTNTENEANEMELGQARSNDMAELPDKPNAPLYPLVDSYKYS